jgi:hypothetical protein
MRWSRALIAALFVLAVAACSSPPASDPDDNPDDGGSSNPPAASQAAASEDDGGNGGNGGNGGDAEAAFQRLTPPNAEEVTKTTASGVIFAAFTTPDSVESLTSFYEDAFDDLGLQILTTTETSGGISWFVGTDENASEFGGVVSAIPATDGGSGSTVSVQIGATNQ